MALLTTEFVMGTENKVPASSPDGEHMISASCLKNRLGDVVILKEKCSVKLIIEKLVYFGVNWVPMD